MVLLHTARLLQNDALAEHILGGAMEGPLGSRTGSMNSLANAVQVRCWDSQGRGAYQHTQPELQGAAGSSLQVPVAVPPADTGRHTGMGTPVQLMGLRVCMFALTHAA